MAKKQSTGNFSPGTPVRVKPGVSVPEFPAVSCAGWSGIVVERVGSKSAAKYVIEWDDPTVDRMPRSYVEQCESQNLFYRMACLSAEELEPAG